MEQMSMKWTGVRALLMHNGDLADAMNPYARQIKEISSKGSKKTTDSDLINMARLEWEGSLYWDDKIGPFIPNDNIERCLQLGAQRKRKGKEIACAAFVIDDLVPLKYSGPKTKDKLFADQKYQLRKGVVLNGRTRIIRCRPRFPEWEIAFSLEYDESVLNPKTVLDAAIDAGVYVGLGDWRGKYGRFTVDLVQ